MIRTLCLLGCFSVVPLVGQSEAYQSIPSELDLLLGEGIEATMLQTYDVADSIFCVVTDRFDKHPAGPVMRAAVAHLRSEDRLEPVDQMVIDSLILIAELRGREYGLETEAGRVALAFVSSGRGIVSLTAAGKGAWIKGLRYALMAASLGEEILEQDSTIADAGLAVGNYYYWKSRRVEIISWLPFVIDNREEGMELLRRCATAGSYQKYAAINSLVWILLDAGLVSEADMWVNTGLRNYPLNRALLKSKAAVQKASDDVDGELATWRTILTSLRSSDVAGGWFEYEVAVRTAELLLAAERSEEVNHVLRTMKTLERVLPHSPNSGKQASLRERAGEVREEATRRATSESSPVE